jgi:hypothetical protein
MSQTRQTVITKSFRLFRLGNERDGLKNFQGCNLSLRPLFDDIVEPQDPPAIVLEHLNNHFLRVVAIQRLNKKEIK